MLKLGKLNINNAYLGRTGVQKMYLGADLVWGGEEPESDCYAIVDTLAEYTGDYPWLWVDSESKWYIRNEQNTYEPYGVFVNSINTTTYKGKLAIVDDIEYEWNGSKWVNVGVAYYYTPVVGTNNFSKSGTYKNYTAYIASDATVRECLVTYNGNCSPTIYCKITLGIASYGTNTWLEVYVNDVLQHKFQRSNQTGTSELNFTLDYKKGDVIKLRGRKNSTTNNSTLTFSLGEINYKTKEYEQKESAENPMVFDTVADMEAYGCVFEGMKAMVGDVAFVYIGNEWILVQQNVPNALKFTTNGNQKQSLGLTTYGNPSNIVSLEYSTNGVVWSNYTKGTKISFSGNFPLYMRVRNGATNNTFGTSNTVYWYFVEGNNTVPYTVSGNILYLLNSNGIVSSLPNYCFTMLFSNCKKLVDASQLTIPSNTVNYSSLSYLFFNCTGLVKAPAVLSATKFANANSYYRMFQNCSSLVNAPALPATTLNEYCYYEMFSNCTSLVDAPVLPASTVPIAGYARMFNGCSKLKNVTMLATKLASDNSLSVWLSGVPSTGTFTCASGMSTVLPRGTSGIPTGWSVTEAS